MKKTTRDAYYFAFSAKDWRSSESVRLMSPAERGCFVDLLAISWLSSTEPCSIPAGDSEISALLGIQESEWKVYAPRVLAEFDVTTEKGRLRNEKLWSEYQKMRTEHRRKVKGGRTSALRPRDEHGRLLPASLQDSTKTLGPIAGEQSPPALQQPSTKSPPSSQSQSQSHSKEIVAGAHASRPAQFPGFTREQCDGLYGVWSRFGNPPYPSFRKALGPVLSGPDKRSFEDVKAAMEEAIARAERDEREAKFLTIHNFAQKVGYWIGEAKGRPVVDPASGTLRRAV